MIRFLSSRVAFLGFRVVSGRLWVGVMMEVV